MNNRPPIDDYSEEEYFEKQVNNSLYKPMDEMPDEIKQKLLAANNVFKEYEEQVMLGEVSQKEKPQRPSPSTSTSTNKVFKQNTAKSNNPLKSYFRQPGTAVHLPSKGIMYKSSDVGLNTFGQITIRPMTAADELMLKSPDELFNGDAIINLISSCCPSITDPSVLVVPDIDVILLGIRIATYGETLEVNSECPNNECKHQNNVAVNIKNILDTVTFFDESDFSVEIDDLKYVINPHDFESMINLTMATYKESKIIRQLGEELNNEDVQIQYLKDTIMRMGDINMGLMVKAIKSITMPDGVVVDDPLFIEEFLNEVSSSVTKQIEKHIQYLNEFGVSKRIKVKCEKCGNEYETAINFDPTSFFG